jgi:ABC-type multidrug transport system fused ATPase/permease subunit
MKSMSSKKAGHYLKIFKDLVHLTFYKEKSLKKRVVYTILLILLTIFLNLISPFLLKKIVECFSLASGGLQKNYLFLLGFLYSFSWFMSQISVQLREVISFKIIERIIRNLTLKIFNKINTLKAPSSYFRNFRKVLEYLKNLIMVRVFYVFIESS